MHQSQLAAHQQKSHLRITVTVFYDEGQSIDTKSDTEGNEPVVDGNQDSVRVSPKCYNGSAQLVQLKQPPHHREESGTGVVSSSAPKSQELLIDHSPRCLSLHTAFPMGESIVARLAGENNARNPEGDTEDGIEYSDEEVLQDGDGIAPSSKAVLMVSQK